MQIELDPIVRMLGLEGKDGRYEGQLADVEVVARLTTIGMAAAAAATQRILDDDVDGVVVVGIAGGVDPGLAIGDVLVPETVVERSSGRTFRPSAAVDRPAPRGTLSCGDDLIVDAARLRELADTGVVALDMETAAVAAVCDAAGVPWTVFRAISDRPADGLLDDGVFALTNPDGSAEPEAVARYLESHPEQMAALAQLAEDTARATEAAAAAAIRACRDW